MPTLEEVYNDPKTTSRNPKLLAQRAGVTVAEARNFLKEETSANINKQFIQPPAGSSAYSPTGDLPDHWQADVIYFDILKGHNDKKKAILTVLNTTNRFALARALTNNKSATVATAMTSILDELATLGRNFMRLRVDGGSEFKGACQEMLTARGIEVERTEPFTHYRITRTDRFHRTLRKRVGELIERNDNDRWVPHLQDIIDNYNSTPQETLTRAIGTSTAPETVTADNELRIRALEMEKVRDARAATDALNVWPGQTRARLLVAKTKQGIMDRFAKSHRAVWTRESYMVKSRNGPNSWLMEVPEGDVKIWPSWALQFLTKEQSNAVTWEEDHGDDEEVVVKKPSSKRVNVKVARAQRLETRNISEAEQAEALQGIALHAGARPKRAARVDYKKLAGKK
jgi:hypothetical protein